MAKKILLPVFPSDRFYDAVVRAGDIVALEGGLIVFAFTRVRPSPEVYEADPDGHPGDSAPLRKACAPRFASRTRPRCDGCSELSEMRHDLFGEHLHVVDLAVEVAGFRAEPEP